MKFVYVISAIYLFLGTCYKSSANEPLDLIIYGATPAGISAAVTATELKMKVLLIEPTNYIGGIMTSGLGASDHCNKKAIGGFARKFFKLIGKEYDKSISWRFESKIASKVFNNLVEQNKINLIKNERLIEAKYENKKVVAIKGVSQKWHYAKYFIDASYEGDLMSASNVTYVIGRENKNKYNENNAGVQPFMAKHQFPVFISAYDSNGKLLSGISPNLNDFGTGDDKNMAYNYRLCVTNDKDNQAPFPSPANYNKEDYELLGRWLESSPSTFLRQILLFLPIPNNKYDVNNIGPFSTDFIGGNWDYPLANFEKRQKIVTSHKEYTIGLLHFLKTDQRVPNNIKVAINNLGLCKDEFTDNNNWPYQLYVRVAKRMLGEHVLIQQEMSSETKHVDSIGLASCPIESHSLQRVVVDGKVMNEGWAAKHVTPYQIPYRSIIPKSTEIQNLIVPVAVSASHIAYSSLRMEPVFMILGESAAVATKLALDSNNAVQNISIKKLRERLRARKQRLSAMH